MIIVDELTVQQGVDDLTIDELTVDELTLDELTWYLLKSLVLPPSKILMLDLMCLKFSTQD